MPPRKQPPRLDQLCAATFARSLLKRFVEIESLKKKGEIEEANRLLDAAKSLCENALPVPVLEKYFGPIFRVVYLEASKQRQIPAMETMLSCLCKPGMRILDLSWLYNPGPISIRPMLNDLVPPMSNLRVAILRRSATDKVLQLLTRECKHLEVLDISRACLINFETLKLFSPEAAKRFPDVHGCPNLSSFRLLGCEFSKSPWPQELARLLKGLKRLEEFACNGLTGAFEDLWKQQRGREASDPVETSDLDFDLLLEHHGENGRIILEFLATQGPLRGSPNKDLQPPTEDKDVVFRLKELSIFVTDGSPYRDVVVDFVIDSCPDLKSFQLTTPTEGHLGGLSRLKRLTKLNIATPFISARGPQLSCFTSRLTSLELQVNDLCSGVLVAVGKGCEDLTELKISLVGDSRDIGVYPVCKEAFRKLETLHFKSRHRLVAVDKEEWLYLTSGATNLVEVRVCSVVDFMTDEFWVNFLTNVNDLKFLRRMELVSKNVNRGHRMGKITLDAFLGSCPDLRNLCASFDTHLLPDDEFEEIRRKMKDANYNFVLSRL